MSREILLVVDALAREKNVSRDIVFGALELALASATKKRIHDEADVRVDDVGCEVGCPDEPFGLGAHVPDLPGRPLRGDRVQHPAGGRAHPGIGHHRSGVHP